MSERPDTVHGRLMEAVHISGYSFERACSELEWLLDDDRWKSIGQGYTDINEFLATIDFSGFRIAIEQRKKLAKRLKDIEASGRATARMLGVDEGTIRNDTAEKSAAGHNERRKSEPKNETAAGNSAPLWFQDTDLNLAGLAKRQVRVIDQRAERLNRIEEISKANAPLALDRRYPVIYADPPWRYEHPPMGDGNRSIENHYPTMLLEEICALPVGQIAADDAVLYLWATAPKLYECMQVIDAWGFVYRTSMVWVKDKIGMGYYARNQHELLLVARRGELPPPAPDVRPPSVVQVPRGEHSAKPAQFYEIIERCYPDLGKIELFSRTLRNGWAAWGNQSVEGAAYGT